MDYEKKYKEALELAKDYFKVNQRLGELEENDMLSDIFPELTESKDERIRKWIIGVLSTYEHDKNLIDDAIAWLEKQGQVKESTISQHEENERIRKALICGMYALKEQHKTCFASIPIDNAIAWLEKQGEFYTKRDVDNAYIEGMAFAKNELEKQGKQKGYTFKSIPRLIDMIEPSDKAKAYCQKLIDALAKEGYNTDAKIVEEVLKGWNGEDVPMAIMDEQKPVFEMKTPEKSLGIDSDTYNKIVDECIYGDGEQNSADKLEPKFHKGEWIVWKDKCYKVNYNGCGYELVDQDGLSTSLEYGTIDENAHIWDVTTDAKDGDVLISRYNKPFIYNGNWNSLNIGSYCGITTEGMFNVATEKCYWTGNVNIHPATKEQRDLLFQKMKESDYKWNAEKKELKKINSYCQENCKGFQETGKCFADEECKAKREAEQKPTDEEIKTLLRTEYEKGRADAIAEMQNHAWSEEDECYMSECIGAIATKDGWSFEEKRKTKHWLKSLKDRVQPRRRHTIFDEII